MRAWLLVCLLLAVGVAGCFDTPADAREPRAPGTEDDGAEGLAAPHWVVGDWWNYTDSFGSQYSIVVSGESGGDWVTDTDNPLIAFVEAQFSDISYVGRISKAGLVAQQNGAPVRYFDFPLEDGKTWNTRWDEREVRVTATQTGPESFQMEGVVDDSLTYRYTYSNASRFLESLEEYRSDGTLSYQMELQASGTGFAGGLVRVRPQEILNATGSGPLAESGTLEFPGAEDADLVAGISVTCEVGAGAIAIGPAENVPGAVDGSLDASGDGYSVSGPCPVSFGFFGVIGRHLDQGTWGYALNAASEDISYSIVLWLRHFERITL